MCSGRSRRKKPVRPASQHGATFAFVALLATQASLAARPSVGEQHGTAAHAGLPDALSAVGSLPAKGQVRSRGAAGAEDALGGAGKRKLLLPIRKPHTWMGHLVPERERRMGLLYSGDHSRLRAALSRYHATGKLVVGVVGGSISSGAGAVTGHSWVEHLEDWMGSMFNSSRDEEPGQPRIGDPNVRVANGAVPGTCSSYMSVCYGKHVPEDADIVVVEYALNDEYALEFEPSPDYVRRGFERLLRKLLNYPNKPAVVILNAFTWFQASLERKRYNGMYSGGADTMYLDLATFYQLPLLSIKACCYHLMQQGVPGFQVNRTRLNMKDHMLEPDEVDAHLKELVFNFDNVHPSGPTGHRAMADLVIDLLHHEEKKLKRRPWSEAEAQHMQRLKLPQPMLLDNWESPSDKCYIGDSLRSIIDPSTDFQWANDVPASKRPKWGFISSTPGHVLRFTIDTLPGSQARAPAQGQDQHQQGQGQAEPKPTAVEVAHLKSYEGMGMAKVSCVSGCTCSPSVINGTIDMKASLVLLHEVLVTPHAQCVMEVRVEGPSLPAGSPGSGSKVKISGVMVDELGGPSQLTIFTALDLVSAGMSSSGTFDLKHTIGVVV